MKKIPYKSTDLICLECGYLVRINRYENRQKKAGHIKSMYCPSCLKEVKFYEVKDIDCYKWEHKNKPNLTDIEKHIMELIMKREENDERELYRISKKILTKK